MTDKPTEAEIRKEDRMFGTTVKCAYCGDPVYDHQEIVVVGRKKYHKGCRRIRERESK